MIRGGGKFFYRWKELVRLHVKSEYSGFDEYSIRVTKSCVWLIYNYCFPVIVNFEKTPGYQTGNFVDVGYSNDIQGLFFRDFKNIFY